MENSAPIDTSAPNVAEGAGMNIEQSTPNTTITFDTSDAGESPLTPNTAPDTSNESIDESKANTSENNSNPDNDDETLKEDVTKSQETLKAVEKDLRNKGVDFKQAIKEYEESGNISSRTLANLVNAGYPKEVIESFIAGRQAIEQRFTEAVFKAAGGRDQYMELTNWAKGNLTEGACKAFNKALDSNDLDLIGLMIGGIKAKMTATRGTRNPTLLGSAAGSGTNNSTGGFTSKQEMIKAMSDPRYTKDPAYTRSVEQRMFYTNF